MDVTIRPRALSGSLDAIASKSMAHRQLILAALCPQVTDIACATSSQDIEATIRCLEALGARIARTRAGFRVRPIPRRDGHLAPTPDAVLDCGESGSTLRFMVPVLAALGTPGRLVGHGRLAQRPLEPLYGQLVAHGGRLGPQGAFPLSCQGPLRAGTFELAGDVSSQFVTGLLLASTVMGGPVRILVRKPVESLSYVRMTLDALAAFGVDVAQADVAERGADFWELAPAGPGSLSSPGLLAVEGDWSCGAFWLAAAALGGSGIAVRGLSTRSSQGDRQMATVMGAMGARVSTSGQGVAVTARPLSARTIDVSDIPDLSAPIAAVCAFAPGTSRIVGAARLRLKESDRIETICAALSGMGARVSADADSITIQGGPSLAGGQVDAAGDHRIAMMAAIAAAYATGPTTIHGAECVAKSYPGFFQDFRALGGLAERSAD